MLTTQTNKKVPDDYGTKLDSLSAETTTTTKFSSTTATKAAGEEDKENKLLQTEKRLERAASTRTNYGLRDKDARK